MFTTILNDLLVPNPLQDQSNAILNTIEHNMYKDNKIITEPGFGLQDKGDLKNKMPSNDSAVSKKPSPDAFTGPQSLATAQKNTSGQETPDYIDMPFNQLSDTTINRESAEAYKFKERAALNRDSSQRTQQNYSQYSGLTGMRQSRTPKLLDTQKSQQSLNSQRHPDDFRSDGDNNEVNKRQLLHHQLQSNVTNISKRNQSDMEISDMAQQIGDKKGKNKELGQTELNEQTRSLLHILDKPSQKRNEQDIAFMMQFLKYFDFVKKAKAQKLKKLQEQKERMYQQHRSVMHGQASEKKNESHHHHRGSRWQSSEATSRQQSANQTKTVQDWANLEQICKVMKPLMVPKHSMVFDYDSEGDLFYMVLHGEVDCKIKMHRQVVLLSEEEKKMFLVEFKDDIIKLWPANEINKKLVDGAAPDGARADDQEPGVEEMLSRLDALENPYLQSKEDLIKHIDKLIGKQKARALWKMTNSMDAKKDAPQRNQESGEANINRRASSFERDQEGPNLGRKQSVQLQSQTNLKTSQMTDPLQEGNVPRVQNNQSQLEKIGNNSSSNMTNGTNNHVSALLLMESHALDHDDGYQNLVQASRDLLNQFDIQDDPDQQPIQRRYYYVSKLRKVHTYKAFESFGELALIQNKRRAAQLTVNGSSDAYFAILSKKDYRQAQYKAQNEILQGKLEFLRKFIIFQNLSDHALSGLTYQMKEMACQRGQEIYREDLDAADKIYLVKKGEFKSLKKIPNKDASTEESLMDIGLFVKYEHKNDEYQDDPDYNANINVHKFKQQQSNSKHQLKSIKNFIDIDVCIHHQLDLFGFQELFSDMPNPTCTSSVVCLQPNSIIVAIERSDLNVHIRRNPTVFRNLIEGWDTLVQKRIGQQQLSGDKKLGIDEKPEQKVEDIKHNQKIRREIEEIQSKGIEIPVSMKNTIDFEASPRSIKLDEEPLINKHQSQDGLDNLQAQEKKQNTLQQFQSIKNFETGIRIDALEQQGKYDKQQKARKEGMNSLDSIQSSHRNRIDRKGKLLLDPITVKTSNVEIGGRHQESRHLKKGVDVNYNDFRKSILSSVSPKEYQRIRKMETYIQNVLRKKQGKNSTKIPVKVEGSLKNQRVILQAQNIPKCIKMHQGVLKSNMSSYSNNLISKKIEKDNFLQKSKMNGSVVLLPALRGLESKLDSKTTDGGSAIRNMRYASSQQSIAFNQRMRLDKNSDSIMELQNNYKTDSKLNLLENDVDKYQAQHQLKKGDHHNMSTGNQKAFVNTLNSSQIDIQNQNDVYQLNNQKHNRSTVHVNSGQTGTAMGTYRKGVKDLELNPSMPNVAPSSSVSQAFTQDLSDWNKESAIVEDQVHKFLMKKDGRRKNTTERPRLQPNDHQFLLANQVRSPIVKTHGTPEATPGKQAGLPAMGSSMTFASQINYSDIPIDNTDLDNKEKILKEQKSIQRKLQESALKDYDFGKDIKDLIFTKYEKDKTNSVQETPRSQEKAHAENPIQYQEQLLESQNKSYLSMKQDHESSFMKVKEGILKNPLIAQEKSKYRYGTSNQKHRNIFFERLANVDGQGMTAQTFHRDARRGNKANRKVLNVYKRYGQSKLDIFVANAARQTLDQESSKLVNMEQSINNDTLNQTETADANRKSILQRYKQKQTEYQHNSSKLSFPNKSQLKTTQSFQKFIKAAQKGKKTIGTQSNKQLSLPKIIMRQIVFEKDDVTQKTIAEQDYVRKLYLEQMNQLEAEEMVVNDREALSNLKQKQTNTLESMQSSQIHGEQIIPDDSKRILNLRTDPSQEGKVMNDSIDEAQEEYQAPKNKTIVPDVSFKDIFLKKQLRDARRGSLLGHSNYQRSKQDSSIEKGSGGSRKTIEVCESRYSKGVAHQHSEKSGVRSDEKLSSQDHLKSKEKEPVEKERGKHEVNVYGESADVQIRDGNLGNLKGGQEIQDDRGPDHDNKADETRILEHDDNRAELNSQAKGPQEVPDRQPANQPNPINDIIDHQRDQLLDQQSPNKDQPISDGLKPQTPHESGMPKTIEPEQTIDQEPAEDKLAGMFPQAQGAEHDVMEPYHQKDVNETSQQSTDPLPPAIIITKQRTVRPARTGQEASLRSSLRQSGQEGSDPASKGASIKTQQPVQDNIKALGRHDQSKGSQPSGGGRIAERKPLRGAFAARSPPAAGVQEAKSESGSDDSVLPEYRKNARKLTEQEIAAQEQYHRDNLKKFSEEMTGGIKINIEYKPKAPVKRK